MCDIYYAKCCKCNKKIMMHLGDYATKRDELLIFCGKHVPLMNGIEYLLESKYIYGYVDAEKFEWEHVPRRKYERRVLHGYEDMQFMGIIPLTHDARKFTREGYNHPNYFSYGLVPVYSGRPELLKVK